MAIGYNWLKKGFYKESDLSNNNEWRKLIGRHRDYHPQIAAAHEFLAKIDAFHHREAHPSYTYYGDALRYDRCLSEYCQICPDIDKCYEEGHCYYFKMNPQFNWNEGFGSLSNGHFVEMQRFLRSEGLNLVIFDAGDKYPFFSPRVNTADDYPRIDNTITLIRSESNGVGHFDFVKKVESYLKCEFFCYNCCSKHSNVNHVCEGQCVVCGNIPKCQGGDKVDCDVCRKTFLNQECFDYHLTESSRSPCMEHKICDECGVRFKIDSKNPDLEHKCFQRKCKDCKKTFTEVPHYCLMKTLDKAKLFEEDKMNKIIVTFDIESQLKTDQISGITKHNPILVVAGNNYIKII